MKKIFLCLLMIIVLTVNVKAECKSEELNEWATTAEVEFHEIKTLGLNSSKYAYVLSVAPERKDIRLVAYDGKKQKATSKSLSISQEEAVIGIGCYTNLEEETYTIEVYGATGGECENDLLKTMTYTVPRFNRYIKDRRCENNDSELCQTFTNLTENMTEAEFDKALKQEINDTAGNDTFKTILKYSLFVVVPLAIVSIIYVIRIGKYQKEERDK